MNLATLILAALAAAQSPQSPLQAEMQQLERSRNAAIRAGDMTALNALYAADFRGIAGGGARVDRETLLDVFRRNAGGDFLAESEVLSARESNGLIFVEGRLRLLGGDRQRLLSDSLYLHVFRRTPQGWEMVSGSATPVRASTP